MPLTNPLFTALDLLKQAGNGAQMDPATCRLAYGQLRDTVAGALTIDHRLNDAELSPDGDTYNTLFATMGLADQTVEWAEHIEITAPDAGITNGANAQHPGTPVPVVLCLPSVEGQAQDIIRIAPDGMDRQEAEQLANTIVRQVTTEFGAPGGLRLENNLQIGDRFEELLSEHGFVSPEMIVLPPWDITPSLMDAHQLLSEVVEFVGEHDVWWGEEVEQNPMLPLWLLAANLATQADDVDQVIRDFIQLIETDQLHWTNPNDLDSWENQIFAHAKDLIATNDTPAMTPRASQTGMGM